MSERQRANHDADRVTPAPPGFAGRSGLGDVALILARLRDAGGAGLLVAALTAVLAVLSAGVPAGYAALSANELRVALATAGPTARQLIATSSAEPATGVASDPSSTGLTGELDQRYGFFTEQLEGLRQTFPEPLRTHAGRADWSILTSPVTFGEADRGTVPAGATQIVQTRAVLDPGAHADLVAGRWPPNNGGGDAPVAIALSEDAAAHLGWAPGEEHGPFVVTGVFRAVDPDADYWALNPGMVRANVFDDGNSRPSITVVAFANPLDFTRTAPGQPDRSRPGTLKVWYPLDLTGLTGAESGLILSQLRGVTARTNALPGGRTSPDELGSLSLSAAAIPVLDGVQGRLVAARAVLTVAVVGPLGAALAVLLLGLRTLAARRRAGDTAIALRGASGRRLRGWRALDGLVFGLPAAAGVAVVRWAFGTDLPPVSVTAGVVVGLLPAILLAAAPIRRTLSGDRPEVAPRRTARRRWLIDVTVCGLAAVSVYLLVTVGVGDSTGGPDLLVAAAPVLLAGAACVLVLRLYPFPLGMAVRRLRRGRSAVAFLGAVRGLRDPAVGVAPVLAVVTGVSLAVFSAGTLSTMQVGVAAAAAERLGAPLRLDGPMVTDAMLAQVQALPGVKAAARLELGGLAALTADGRPVPGRPQLYLADTAELAAVQTALGGALPDGPAVPAGGLGSAPAGANAAVTSPGLVTDAAAAVLDGRAVTVVGTAAGMPGFPPTDNWLLLDRRSGVTGNGARTLLLATDRVDAAARADLEQRVLAITGPGTFRTPADLVAETVATPATGAIRAALIAAIVAAALAAAAAVVLTLVLNTRSRARLLAIARVLGMSARDRRRLVLWEQGPSALVALIVGAGLGLGITALLRSVVDLRPFTAGTGQPALVFDAGTMGLLLGGFVLLVALAVQVGTVLARRSTAAAAKVDQE